MSAGLLETPVEAGTAKATYAAARAALSVAAERFEEAADFLAALPERPPLARGRPGGFARSAPAGLDALRCGGWAPGRAVLEALGARDEGWRTSYAPGEAEGYGAEAAWRMLASSGGPLALPGRVAAVMAAGPGLRYPRHRHGPEELYLVLAGGIAAEAEGRAERFVAAGAAVRHAAWQAHAMTTGPEGAALLAVWLGDYEKPELLEGAT